MAMNWKLLRRLRKKGSYLRVRFASTNAPESRKKGLLADRVRRVQLLFAFYLSNRIDIGSVQEAGTYAKQVDPSVKGIKTLWAKANSIVKGRLVGNGVFANRLRFKTKRMPDLVAGDLNVAVVKVVHRRSGFTWTHIAPHRRTRRDDPSGADRRLMNKVLTDFIKGLERDGAAWTLAGDANEGEQWAIVDLGKSLGIHNVDHIIASAHFIALGYHSVSKPRLSDHDFLIADAAVKV